MSLRVRLVSVVVLLVAGSLIVSGLLATSLLRAYLTDQVDAQLVDFATSPMLRGGAPAPPPGGQPAVGDTTPVPTDFYVSVADADGTVLASSGSSFTSASPSLPKLSQAEATTVALDPYSVDGSDATRWRAVTVPLSDGAVTVARDITDVVAIPDRLALLLAGVGMLVVSASAGAAWILVTRHLQPLSQVEHAARQIAAGDLSRRVPERDPRSEVGQMSLALNSMLTRLEDAFADREAALADAQASEGRMRTFIADASHELRTPLTAVRGYAELYRQGAVGPDDVASTFARIEGEAGRMATLVDDLLLLARLDRQRPLRTDSVEVTPLAASAVATAAATHPGRSIALQAADTGTSPVVHGDAERLTGVVANLLGNALRYSDGPVSVGISTTADRCLITVADHGPGISDADKPHVFTRFYRADTARSRSHGGSGLGLSIVDALVTAHGGEVAVADTPGGGATFTVSLPLLDLTREASALGRDGS